MGVGVSLAGHAAVEEVGAGGGLFDGVVAEGGVVSVADQRPGVEVVGPLPAVLPPVPVVRPVQQVRLLRAAQVLLLEDEGM